MTTQVMNQKTSAENHATAWHKQFWVWFIIALLVTTVIAGITTIVLAVKHDDSLVVDNYYKKGLAINQVLTQKQNALDMKVSASLSFDQNREQLTIRLPEQHETANNILKIRLVHATIADMDREHFLTRHADNGYAVKLDGLQAGWWRIMIEPVDEVWQIEQRVQFPFTDSITIKPVL